MSAEELETARLSLMEADAAAASIRRRIRATSTPLLVAGVVGTAASVNEWVTGDLFTTAFLIGWVTIAVLGALAWRERRRWSRDGVAGVPGYGVAALVFFAVGWFVIPLQFFGLAGPFLGFAIVLVLFGLRDRRPRLVAWTTVLATIGTAENYYAFTNRLSYHSWNEFLHNAILVATGLLFIVAGLIERRHENRT